jgi:UDP-N-acetyl-D-mannosaminuronic acid dehydrogenase
MQALLDKKVCVIGLGYIGLPTATVLASRGYDVRGVEINPRVVEIINAGHAHVVEPDLDLLVRAAVQTGKLKAHATPAPADIFIICVPTPTNERHAPDLKFVDAAAETICSVLKPGNLVILESTSPPGTTERIAEIVARKSGLRPPQLMFAHAPERVLPGKILREVVENDRVIGGIDDASTQACAAFYQTFVSGELHLTDCRTAETVKLVENAYRDVNIAFANELSMFADRMNLDVWEVIRLANRHPRVNILNPGCGVGGHCIAVDPWFLVSAAPEMTRLIKTSREVNTRKPRWVVERVCAHANKFKHPTIACLGLAYKPDIDDLRESPAVEIVEELMHANVGALRVVEPNISSHPKFQLTSIEDAVSTADIVLVLVGHKEFKRIPGKLLAEKIVIDTTGTIAGARSTRPEAK